MDANRSSTAALVAALTVPQLAGEGGGTDGSAVRVGTGHCGLVTTNGNVAVVVHGGLPPSWEPRSIFRAVEKAGKPMSHLPPVIIHDHAWRPEPSR